MDLRVGPEVEAYREKVARFLRENLPDGWAGIGALDAEQRAEFLPRWRETLLEHGYLGVNWPAEFGGTGLSIVEHNVLGEEFAKAGVPTLPLPSDLFGFMLIGPTLLVRGTEEQKRQFIPKILSGEYRFAQGFSEPEAGSDLFSLRTRAVLDGSGDDAEWVVNGQKVWQTEGDKANWIFVLARTEPDAPKAKGISMLLVPIEQPGVLVRPIRSMTGDEEFCEVFFEDARTAAENIVGARGEGASVTMTLLGFERGSASGKYYIEHRQELERLVALAREHGKADDPVIRQRIAWCFSKVEVLRLLGLRALTAAQKGRPPGAESSILKLFISEFHSRLTELAMDILGPQGLVTSGGPVVTSLGPHPRGVANSPAAWQNVYLTARAATIYGGSSQIQRNTLGERVLGLPREPRPAPADGRAS